MNKVKYAISAVLIYVLSLGIFEAFWLGAVWLAGLIFGLDPNYTVAAWIIAGIYTLIYALQAVVALTQYMAMKDVSRKIDDDFDNFFGRKR